MSSTGHLLLLFLVAGVLFIPPLHSQNNPTLEFRMPKELPARQVEFQMSKSSYKKIRSKIGQKFNVKEVQLIQEDEPMKVKKLRVRGKTTLNYPKKSFSVNLDTKTRLYSSNLPEERKIKKFYLLSLVMDPHHYRNQFAFSCLEELGIFSLYRFFTEVKINGEAQGIYLFIQKPDEFALKDQNSPYVLRRGYKSTINEDHWNDEADSKQVQSYRSKYRSILKISRRFQGEQLYHELNKVMDLQAYFKWLAFNYWIRNGDYSDEVYFYLTSGEEGQKFTIIPWDYDDIFAKSPHEGAKRRNFLLGSKMLFSGEEEFDLVIGRDEFLYQKYLIQFRHVLIRLSVEKIKTIFESIYTQLYPYYQSAAIEAITHYSQQPPTSLKILQSELQNSFHLMCERRKSILHKLN